MPTAKKLCSQCTTAVLPKMLKCPRCGSTHFISQEEVSSKSSNVHVNASNTATNKTTTRADSGNKTSGKQQSGFSDLKISFQESMNSGSNRTWLIGSVAAVVVIGIVLGVVNLRGTRVDCASGTVQKLVRWTVVSDLAKKISNSMVVGELVVALNGGTLGALLIPPDKINSVLDRKCEGEMFSEEEKTFCSVLKSRHLDSIRTRSKTDTLAVCAAFLVGTDGDRGNEFTYRVEKTSDGGIFVTVNTQ